MKTRELGLISVAIVLVPFAVFSLSASKDIGDLGSLLGASSGFIAVIWFYHGLRLQSLQIDEQRLQFSKQYHLQYQESLLAFLEKASDKVKCSHQELISALGLPDSNQLAVKYLQSLSYYKEALESTDPNVVTSHVQDWMKIEGPCVKFMTSVKDVITLHKRRLGLEDDPDTDDVADYVFINSGHLLQQPFMSSFQVSIKMLSEQMMIISPGRKAMVLAITTAMALLSPEGLIKKDKIIQDINGHKSQNKPIPKICDVFIANQPLQ
jgi:hypothetical protein